MDDDSRQGGGKDERAEIGAPKYWAFISYSHADEHTARWLHRALERYRVPSRLHNVDRTASIELPKRLYPVFRDRDELASSAELGPEIRRALEASRNLIVLCSTRSAHSHWVNEEIRHFKLLGRADRIFCLILDGEPGHPENECFPKALRMKFDENGQAIDGHVEPMAADLRSDRDGRRAALLKLIAGSLSVNYDDLRQRDLGARNRRLSLIAFASLGIAAMTIALAVSADRSRRAAEKAQITAQRTADFMESLFVAANPNESRPNLLARDLLEAGARRIDEESLGDLQLKARLQFTIGKAYCAMRIDTECDRLQEGAMELQRSAAPDSVELADMLSERAQGLMDRERLDEAQALTEKAMAVYRKAVGPESVPIARQMVRLVNIRLNRKDVITRDVEEMLDHAVDIFEQRVPNTEEHSRAVGLLASIQEDFAWERKAPLHQKAIEIGERVHGKNDIRIAFRIENLARMHYFSGNYEAATPLFGRTIQIISNYKGGDHMELNWSRYYLSRIRREQGHATLARDLMEGVVRSETATPQTSDQRYLGRSLCGYALLLADSGASAKARSECELGRSILAPTMASQQRVQMDVVQEALTVIALASGDAELAVEEARLLAEIRRREIDRTQADTPLAIAMHASALGRVGQVEQAENLFQEALDLATQRYGPESLTVGKVLIARAYLRAQQGRNGEANADRERGLRLLAKQQVHPQNPDWTYPVLD